MHRMKEVVIDALSDDAVEIIVETRRKSPLRCAVVCLCCERADQPMDDDGCGICDVCLGLPVSTGRAPDTLECQASSSHLSLTTRNR